MYRILVTTTLKAGLGEGGVAVHTLVLEFGNAVDAKKAAERINGRTGVRSGCDQNALLLFDDR